MDAIVIGYAMSGMRVERGGRRMQRLFCLGGIGERKFFEGKGEKSTGFYTKRPKQYVRRSSVKCVLLRLAEWFYRCFPTRSVRLSTAATGPRTTPEFPFFSPAFFILSADDS